MTRPLRIEFPGAWYHIMNRGANHQRTFFCSDHFKAFLSLLEEIVHDFDVEIHAYCLMPNHYHILMKTNSANLSRVMQHLNGTYTQRFNVMTKRDGPLFRGRYKASLVGNMKYLLYLSRYIHLNPVKANITQLAEAYLWSSAKWYLQKAKPVTWLSVNRILNQFHNSKQGYQDYLKIASMEELDIYFEKHIMPAVLGDDDFKTYIEKRYKTKNNSGEIKQRGIIVEPPTVQSVILYLTEILQPTSETKKSLVTLPMLLRNIAILAARQFGKYSLAEIGSACGNISYSNISRIITQTRTALQQSRKISQQFQEIMRQLDQHFSRNISQNSKFKT